MSSLIDKSLTSDQNRELKRLKRTRSRWLLRLGLLGFVLILIGYNLKKQIISDNPASLDLIAARQEFLRPGIEWTESLNKEQLALEDWLERRGTRLESYLFDKVSAVVFISAAKSLPVEQNARELGAFEGFYLSLHMAVLRIAFILLACFRLWLLFIGIALYFGMRSKKVYEGPDMLGETGNSRLFYSGIRAGLENLNKAGAPNKQVTGLACPKRSSESKFASSEISNVLIKYGVINETNKALGSIILAYDYLPAYVVPQEEEKLYSDFVVNAKLSENTSAILEKVLDLHSFYASGLDDKDFFAYLEKIPPDSQFKDPLSLDDYSKYLQKSLHRTLTPAMREVIGSIPAEHIATMVLAIEAGKVLVFKFEGERWQIKSNYPQLCARSVLHSIDSFAKEHDFDQRTVIRQAIIYSSRTGDFGPVKLPVDLSDQARALRQWTEVLIANPHDVGSAANEVEMYSIVFEGHKKFKQSLFDKIMLGDKETLNSTFATQGNLFLVPFGTIYKLVKQSLTAKSVRRLEELARLASQKRKIKIVSTDSLVDLSEKNNSAALTKVIEPLTDLEIKEISSTYALPAPVIKEWSSLRIVLNNFGWLARRVGDYSVPDSSIIFAVMRCDNAVPGANALGLIGAEGMVPLRATQLEERWGKTWQSRSTQVLTATMAENREDFAKLMRGEESRVLDDNIVNI